MQVHSTADIPLDKLQQSASTLPTEWNVKVADAQMFFKSMEVPSWVSVVAQAPWWVQFFAASASVYISGIISEAGKDTWKNRAKIASAIRCVPSAITQLAKFIGAAKSTGSSKTFVVLAIPFPDEFNTAHLKLEYANPEELELSIALFIHHLPALEELWQQERLLKKLPVGGMQLEFRDDCSLLVVWMDRESLDSKERVLPFGQDL